MRMFALLITLPSSIAVWCLHVFFFYFCFVANCIQTANTHTRNVYASVRMVYVDATILNTINTGVCALAATTESHALCGRHDHFSGWCAPGDKQSPNKS